MIIISALGAVLMYCISMVALLVMRSKAKLETATFKTPFYPYFPWIALLLSLVCLIAIIIYNLILSIIFFAGLVVVLWILLR